MFSASGHAHKAQFPATFALPRTCLKYQFCFHGCFSSCEEILIPESRKFLLVECRIGDIIACGIRNPRIWVLDSLYNMRDFIRGLREDELPLFLRFVTGQDILPHQPIRLMFNRLEGIFRRPIAHTCSNLLNCLFVMKLSSSFHENSRLSYATRQVMKWTLLQGRI